MFHLKFRRITPEGDSERNISCPNYDVWYPGGHTAKRADVVVYKDFLKKDGVEYHVGGPRETAYGVCFITNEAGKTVDRIGPFKTTHDDPQ